MIGMLQKMRCQKTIQEWKNDENNILLINAPTTEYDCNQFRVEKERQPSQ